MTAVLAPADLDSAFVAQESAGSKPLARIYGVRHLSPAGAAHLHTVLDEHRHHLGDHRLLQIDAGQELLGNCRRRKRFASTRHAQ